MERAMTIVKAVVLGDTECGKTSFTKRWVTGNFPDPDFLRTTIGVSFDTKKITLPNEEVLTLSLFDFGGQTRFIEQLKAMIRGAVAGLLFFDVSRLQTFDNLINYWVPMIEENSTMRLREGDGSRFILVANKVDLIDEERIDNIGSEMLYFVDEFGMSGQFISAKTGLGIENLDRMFLETLEQYYQSQNHR
jgi:small GTP-binding protein